MPHASRRVPRALACPQVAKKLHCDAFPAAPQQSGSSTQAAAPHCKEKTHSDSLGGTPSCFRVRARWGVLLGRRPDIRAVRAASL